MKQKVVEYYLQSSVLFTPEINHYVKGGLHDKSLIDTQNNVSPSVIPVIQLLMHWRATERINSCKYLLSHRCMTNSSTCMNRYQILAIFSHKLMNFVTLSSQFSILLFKSRNSCPEKWYSLTTIHSHCNSYRVITLESRMDKW